jgi:hypothetical protein
VILKVGSKVRVKESVFSPVPVGTLGVVTHIALADIPWPIDVYLENTCQQTWPFSADELEEVE